MNKLLQKIKNLAPSAKPPVDPAAFGDPLALRVDWKPLKHGGTNFRTHKTLRPHAGRFEFKATLPLRLFGLIFLAAGLTIMVVGPLVKAQAASGMRDLLILLLVGGVFAGVGGIILYAATTPVVFDKQRGWFWRGRTPPHAMHRPAQNKNCCRLDDIHALQLIEEHCRGNKNSFYSYELNLVLRDERRINVVDHGDCRALRGDARDLAAFLEIPVWDGIP